MQCHNSVCTENTVRPTKIQKCILRAADPTPIQYINLIIYFNNLHRGGATISSCAAAWAATALCTGRSSAHRQLFKNASTRERRAAAAVGIRSAVDVGNDQFADAVLFLTGGCRGVMADDVWYLCFGVVCEGRLLSEGHHITDRRQNTCQRLIL